MAETIDVTLDTITSLLNLHQLAVEQDTETNFTYLYGILNASSSTSTLFSGISGEVSSFKLNQDSVTSFDGISGVVGSIQINQQTKTSLTGFSVFTGSITTSLQSDINLLSSTSGVLDISINSDSSFFGFERAIGEIAVTAITQVLFNGFGSVSVGVLSEESNVLSMNARTLGVSSYGNYNFNSFFKLGQNYYGCSDYGIFLLSGDLDNTSVIQQSILRSNVADYESQKLKGIADCYVYIRSTGDMTFRLVTDEQYDRNGYPMYYDYKDGIHRRRVKVAKGLRGTTWQVEVRNEDGSDFTVKQIDVIPKELKRSI